MSELLFQSAVDMKWHDEGTCNSVDPELFFVEQAGSDNPEARKICRECPVKVKCLQFALDNEEEFGVWGGLTPNGRNRFRRKYKYVTAENLHEYLTRYERNKRDRMNSRKHW